MEGIVYALRLVSQVFRKTKTAGVKGRVYLDHDPTCDMKAGMILALIDIMKTLIY